MIYILSFKSVGSTTQQEHPENDEKALMLLIKGKNKKVFIFYYVIFIYISYNLQGSDRP